MILVRSCRLSGVNLVLAALMIAAGTGYAQKHPPGRVARISYLKGNVSFLPAGQDQWSQATLNFVVTTGDRIYTDKGAKAELEGGNYSIRLAEKTDVTITEIDDTVAQFAVGQGAVRLTVYQLPSGDTIEGDSPDAAITLAGAGSYRVDVDPDGEYTRVIVNSGRVEVASDSVSRIVDAGQAIELRGEEIAQTSTLAPDSFDRWSDERDQRMSASSSAQYVNASTPGYEDLDSYGRWVNEVDYGPVWYPTVAAGWVPYRFGHWAWIDPWGWTWVEDEPWGFCPFHFGRWVLIGAAWGWIPGPIAVRPIYAPAFVAFLGGIGFSIASVDVVAWFPLGPDEPFFPWYHYDVEYLRIVNITNVRNVTNITNIINVGTVDQIRYKYRTLAATAVPAKIFGRGDPVAHHVVPVNPRMLEKARVVPHPPVNPAVHATLPGKPVRPPPVRPVNFAVARRAHAGQPNASVARPPALPARAEPQTVPLAVPQSDRRTTTIIPPRTVPSRFVMRTPPPPPPIPFTQRRQAMIEHPGRPLEPQQLGNLRAGRPAGPLLDREIPRHVAPPHVGPKIPVRPVVPPARERPPRPGR
ncbi:MAG: FecR protein [Candidatus Angelobacter sp.]|nr:FecR protein [Candidatus Angelobacter sp.]